MMKEILQNKNHRHLLSLETTFGTFIYVLCNDAKEGK